MDIHHLLIEYYQVTSHTSRLFAQSQHKKFNAISSTSICLIGQGTLKNR